MKEVSKLLLVCPPTPGQTEKFFFEALQNSFRIPVKPDEYPGNNDNWVEGALRGYGIVSPVIDQFNHPLDGESTFVYVVHCGICDALTMLNLMNESGKRLGYWLDEPAKQKLDFAVTTRDLSLIADYRFREQGKRKPSRR